MSIPEHVAYWLPWLALVAGLVALTVRHRHAPESAGIAIPVLAVMALTIAFLPAAYLADLRSEWLLWQWIAYYPCVQSLGWVLLAVAVMAGRRPEKAV